MNATPSNSTQRQFRFAYETNRGLARVETAMAIMRISEDGVMDAIDSGELIAFNLAKTGATIRLPCVWLRSIQAREENRRIEPMTSMVASVLADILPAGTRPIRGGELMQILAIKSALLHRHIRDGLLETIPGTANKNNRSPEITRASIGRLLAERKMWV